jgi:hypothetical protein
MNYIQPIVNKNVEKVRSQLIKGISQTGPDMSRRSTRNKPSNLFQNTNTILLSRQPKIILDEQFKNKPTRGRLQKIWDYLKGKKGGRRTRKRRIKTP